MSSKYLKKQRLLAMNFPTNQQPKPVAALDVGDQDTMAVFHELVKEEEEEFQKALNISKFEAAFKGSAEERIEAMFKELSYILLEYEFYPDDETECDRQGRRIDKLKATFLRALASF